MIDTEALRKKVIDLAIQGKLTQQLPEDGNAEDLYAQIIKVKTTLIKEGKIKKEKSLPEISDDEIPFDIPGNWKWVRLIDISNIINGDRGKNYPAKSSLSRKGIPFISALNLNGRGVDDDDRLMCLSDEQYDKLGSGKLQKDDIVICIRGSLGKHGKYPFDKGAIASSLVICRPYCYLNEVGGYIMKWLDSSMFPREIDKYDGGSAQPNLAADNLKKFLIPLPPIAEQKRIVEILDSAFVHIEIIDSLQKKYESDREVLKGKIIDAGIRGKLTEQLPEDGNAEDLFKHIQEEKMRLVKEGKIKKETPMAKITDDEIPFVIPKNWKWARLGDLIRISSGNPLTSHDMKDGRIPVYGGNGITGYHNETMVSQRTIVIGRVGFYCGSVHITPDKAWITDNAFITMYPEDCFDQDFLALALKCMNLGKRTNGAAQPVVSGKKIYPLLFPLPPLQEQKRIVEKIYSILSVFEGRE